MNTKQAHRSISVKIFKDILVVSSIVLTIVITLYSLAEYMVTRKNLIEESKSTAKYLSSSISFPLYKLNSEPIGLILNNYGENTNLIGIKIYHGEEKNLYAGIVKNENSEIEDFDETTSDEYLKKHSFKTFNHEITYKNQTIGEVELFITNTFLKQKRNFLLQTIVPMYFFFLLFLSLTIFISVKNSITRPLDSIISKLEQMGKGNFNKHINTIHNLKEFLIISGHIDNINTQIINSFLKLKDTSKKLKESNKHNIEIINTFSQKTIEESVILEEISSKLKTASANIKNLSQTTTDSAKKLENGASKARESTSSFEDIIQSIYDISDHSKKIKKSLNMIYEITEETDMLALNASIEAAKAGEAGKGFSVVASEIRNLAEKSQTTAKEIENKVSSNNLIVEKAQEIIKNSQDTIKNVIEISVSSDFILSVVSTSVNQQVSENDNLLNSLERVNTVMNDILTIIDDMVKSIKKTDDMSESIYKFLSKQNFEELTLEYTE